MSKESLIGKLEALGAVFKDSNPINDAYQAAILDCIGVVRQHTEPVLIEEDCNSCEGTGRVFVRRNSKGEIDYIDGARTGELVNCDVCHGEGKR